jgi:hypothetical protein
MSYNLYPMTDQTRGEAENEDEEYDYSDPSETGLRSGKGSGFISSIFF